MISTINNIILIKYVNLSYLCIVVCVQKRLLRHDLGGQKSLFSFHHVCSKGQTQVFRLGSKHIYPNTPPCWPEICRLVRRTVLIFVERWFNNYPTGFCPFLNPVWDSCHVHGSQVSNSCSHVEVLREATTLEFDTQLSLLLTYRII